MGIYVENNTIIGIKTGKIGAILHDYCDRNGFDIDDFINSDSDGYIYICEDMTSNVAYLGIRISALGRSDDGVVNSFSIDELSKIRDLSFSKINDDPFIHALSDEGRYFDADDIKLYIFNTYN